MQQAELAIVSAKMDCPRGGSLFLWNLREKKEVLYSPLSSIFTHDTPQEIVQRAFGGKM